MKRDLLLLIFLAALGVNTSAQQVQLQPLCKTNHLKLAAIAAEIYTDQGILDLWRIPVGQRVMVVTITGTIDKPCCPLIGTHDFAAVNAGDRNDYYESFAREWTCGSLSSPITWGGSAPVADQAAKGDMKIRAFFIIPAGLQEFEIVDISRYFYTADPPAGRPNSSLGKVKL